MRSISQRVRNRFNLAVSEVGGQDTWQRAVLGIAAAGSEPKRVRSVLERAIAYIEELHLAEVRDSDIEIIRLPYETNPTDSTHEPDVDTTLEGEDWEESGDDWDDGPG